MGFIFKLRHWAIHPVHLHAFVYLFDPFGGAQMPQNSIKKDYFLVVLDHFSYKNGLIDLVRAFFQAKTSGLTSCPFAGLCLPFWIH
jgi:hypothetical protein